MHGMSLPCEDSKAEMDYTEMKRAAGLHCPVEHRGRNGNELGEGVHRGNTE